MRKIRAIIFDLDNTLVDRTASIHRYAGIFKRDFGHCLHALSIKEIGKRLITADAGGYRGKPEMLDAICMWPEWKSTPDREDLNLHWMWEFPAQAVAMNDLEETVEFLKAESIKLGIITNGSARAQNAKIMALGLWKHFPVILVSETAGIKKPDSRLFEMALNQLDTPPKDTWFVGDNPISDMVGARQAGITGVWRTGFHPWPEDHPKPAMQIKALSDIIKLLKNNNEHKKPKLIKS
jgi:putative hydrolase of the HAD superfamily